MKDPLRLVDAGGTEFERLLLTTAAEEAPSSEVSARMLAGVVTAGAAVALLSGVAASGSQLAGEGMVASGVAASGAVQGATQAGLGAAAMAGASGSIAPPAAAGLVGAWLVKWGLVGALISGVAISGGVLSGVVLSGSQPLENGQQPAAAPRAPYAPVPAAAARNAELAPAGAPEAPPSAAVSPVLPAETLGRAPARQRPTPAGAQALGPEIEVLDSARSALAAGDAERALTLIASYHRRFPSGALSQEATVLEVDALEAKGRAEQATDLKEQFLAEHPKSAHTQRVQRSGQAR